MAIAQLTLDLFENPVSDAAPFTGPMMVSPQELPLA
jgi:hypothetical protein